MASETDDKAVAPSEDKDQTESHDQTNTAETNSPNEPELNSATSNDTEPAAKKRRSNIQLNKDDHPDGECDDDGELNDEGEKRSDPFKRASEDVLKGRKIVKVSKKWETASGGGAGSGGVFGNVTLVADKNEEKDDAADKTDGATEKKEEDAPSVFGATAKVPTFGSATSSFGTFGSGFGSVSNGFGAIKSDENGTDAQPKSAFGSGFASSGFGSKSSPTSSGFGTEKDAPKPDNEGAFTASTCTTEKVILQSTAVNNGEENEDCMYEVRAKLYKLAPVQEVEEKEEAGEHVPSVPSTSGRLELKTEEKKEEETKVDKMIFEWKDRGVGPVRVLKGKDNSLKQAEEKDNKSHARIVQRQETSQGGQGTRLILNAYLVPGVCKVTRTSEKIIQLAPLNNIVEDGSGGVVGSYSLRVKTAVEADELQTALEKVLEP
jgi:hypothetical protein